MTATDGRRWTLHRDDGHLTECEGGECRKFTATLPHIEVVPALALDASLARVKELEEEIDALRARAARMEAVVEAARALLARHADGGGE